MPVRYAAGVASGNLLLAFIPPLPIPIAIDAGLSLRVLVFSSAVSLAAGLALGVLPVTACVVPAWRAARLDPVQALRVD